MTRVLLTRHGQSEWNADGRWQGQADPPLTDLGRHQAKHAARNLGVVDAIVTSDLQRASETALIISGDLGVGPVVLEPDLRERDAGEWSGLTRPEIDRDWPGYLDPPPAARPGSFATGNGPSSGFDTGPASAAAEGAAGRRDPPRRPPSWEPDEQLLARADVALAHIYDLAPDGEVIAVTHGGLVYVLEGREGARFERLPNLAGRWLDVGPDGTVVALGERVLLVDPDELTVPAQI
ncbi:MAG: histidine phosphatase family protein [Acidimicrobiales bacterium]